MALSVQNALLALFPLAGDASLPIYSTPDGQYNRIASALAALDYPIQSCFSPDGLKLYVLTALAAGSDDVVLHVFDLAAWQKLVTSATLTANMASAMVATGDGTVVVSATNAVLVIDGATGALVTTVNYQGPPAQASTGQYMALSPDGQYVLLALVAWGLMVVNTSDWTINGTLEVDASFGSVGGLGPSWLAQFSPDGSRLFYNVAGELRCKSWPALETIALPALASAQHVRLLFLNDTGTQFLHSSRDVGNTDVFKVDLVAETEDIFYSLPVSLDAWNCLDLQLSPDRSRLVIFWFSASAYHAKVVNVATQADELALDFPVTTYTSLAPMSAVVWAPTASLKKITGTVRDAANEPAARVVRITGRSQGGVDLWTASGVDGVYSAVVAAGGEVSRIVYDNTGAHNDIIDRVVL